MYILDLLTSSLVRISSVMFNNAVLQLKPVLKPEYYFIWDLVTLAKIFDKVLSTFIGHRSSTSERATSLKIELTRSFF